MPQQEWENERKNLAYQRYTRLFTFYRGFFLAPSGAENGFPTQAYPSFTISALRKAFSSKVTPVMRSSCTRLHPNAFDKDKKSSVQIQTQNPILRRDRSGCPSTSKRQYPSSCSNEGSAPCRIMSIVRLRAMFSICPPLKSYRAWLPFARRVSESSTARSDSSPPSRVSRTRSYRENAAQKPCPDSV